MNKHEFYFAWLQTVLHGLPRFKNSRWSKINWSHNCNNPAKMNHAWPRLKAATAANTETEPKSASKATKMAFLSCENSNLVFFTKSKTSVPKWQFLHIFCNLIFKCVPFVWYWYVTLRYDAVIRGHSWLTAVSLTTSYRFQAVLFGDLELTSKNKLS